MKLFLVSTALLLITACSTKIGVRTQSTKFISPEAIGKSFMGDVSVYISEGTHANLDLNNNQTGNSLELTDQNDDGDFIGVNGEVGALEQMDVVIQKPGESSPIMAGIKYQFIGEPRLKASQGNHSLSVALLAGTGSKEDENDDPVELTPQDDEISTNLNMFGTSASLIYGYRVSQSILFYVGGTYSTMKFDGELESDNNATLDGEEIAYEGFTNEANAGVMFELGRLITLKFEGSNQKVNWEKTSERTFNYFSTAISFNWY